MGFPILDVINSLLGAGKSIVDGWQARQTAQVQADIDLKKATTDAKINLLQTKQAGDIAWENTAIQNSGWKSGYLTIILSVPMVLCFIPAMAHYVGQGFAQLQNVPDWYKAAIGVMVGADFGVRSFVDFMQTKKGAQ